MCNFGMQYETIGFSYYLVIVISTYQQRSMKKRKKEGQTTCARGKLGILLQSPGFTDTDGFLKFESHHRVHRNKYVVA